MSTLKANQPFSTRYHLTRRIGVGGYSEVWLANDTLAGNMQVALKIFAPDKGLDEQGIALFSKEYSLVFNLNHPNLLLPKHFDVADGSPFLVLPYCEPGSVFSKIGMMTEPDLARFLQQAASALAYLHSQKPPIIHQDIKPDNFLIDNQGNYLLSDFGISSKIRRTLTRSMGAPASAGTMAYMPPEKFSADKQVIKAGDIFSLGVTLYELLTGDLPFGDNGGITLNIGAVSPNLPVGFSPELNELLKRCMAKETWERPMAEDLVKSASNYLTMGNWLNGKKVEVTDESHGSTKSVRQPQPKRTVAFAGSHGQPSALNDPNAETNETTTKKKNGNKSKKTVILLSSVGVIIVLLVLYFSGFLGNKSIRFKTFQETVNGVSYEMVAVEGGTFLMGSNEGGNDEKPVHRVTVSDFYMGKTEVTQKLWRAVMGASTSLSNQTTSLGSPSNFKGDGLPVESVSWYDVQEFIEELNRLTGKNFRLPSEAEWEYAAGGTLTSLSNLSSVTGRTKWAGTNSESSLGSYAWYYGNSNDKTHAVGTKSPNRLGLYDMSGNVWEWCSDWKGDYSSSSQTNPQGPSWGSSRVIRGGGWDGSPSGCRAAYRGMLNPDFRFDFVGFRLVLAP